MKKMISLMLGLGLLAGAATFAFGADDTKKSASKKTSTKKAGTKKGTDKSTGK